MSSWPKLPATIPLLTPNWRVSGTGPSSRVIAQNGMATSTYYVAASLDGYIADASAAWTGCPRANPRITAIRSSTPAWTRW